MADLKLTDYQLDMVARLLAYEHRSLMLGGPGVTAYEMIDMFGRFALRTARRLRDAGWLTTGTTGRWRVHPDVARLAVAFARRGRS